MNAYFGLTLLGGLFFFKQSLLEYVFGRAVSEPEARRAGPC